MGKLVLTGQTSGSIVIDAPAVSGSNTLIIPAKTGQVVLCDSTTGAMPLPIGTTAQRPSSPAIGMIRMNTDTGSTEYYNGSSWVNFNA